MISLGMTMLALSLVCCALATAGYLLSLLVKKIELAKVSTWILAIGFLFLTVNLLGAAVHSSGWDNFGSRHFLSIYLFLRLILIPCASKICQMDMKQADQMRQMRWQILPMN